MLRDIKIDKKNLEVLGILIRVSRINHGYSLRKLSSLTNISHTLISNIEIGKQQPTHSTLGVIFGALGLELFTSKDIEVEMKSYYTSILNHIIHHNYQEANELVTLMDKKGEIYKNSFEVVNYAIIRCLFFAITDNKSFFIQESLFQYDKVLEFFLPKQKQLYYFISGLDYLNKDNYKKASNNFEKALLIGDRDLDVLIRQYLVESYIAQFKFTDSVIIASKAIETFEERTIYVRAMICRILIAKVNLKILKLDKAIELVDYIESFADQFKIVFLTDECHILKAGIMFYNKAYNEAIKELEMHSNQESPLLILPKFRTYLVSNNASLTAYYNEIITIKKDLITINKLLLIKVLMMWIRLDYRDDLEYLDNLTALAAISVKSNDQEIVGLAYNLLIIFYREKHKYKQALEVADQLLLQKKIHIKYYSINNT